MKPALVFSPLLSLLFILGSYLLLPVAAQEPTGSRLTLISSDAQEIVVELTVADFQVEPVEYEGQVYQRLVISGAVQSEVAGEPQLPTIGTMLGVPAIEEVKLEILETEFEVLENFRALPVPTLRIIGDNLLESGVEEHFDPDETIYTTAAFYSKPIATIGQTALMRDQPVVQMQFNPAQYNPVSGQVRLYRRILVRLTWPDRGQVQSAVTSRSPAYENVLQSTLLNYGTLSRPPVAASSSSGGAGVVSLAETSDVSPSLKIGVDEDGIYQLTYSDIISAGFKLSGIDPRLIKLTNRGAEIPILVNGESDGVFDPEDTILFYSTAITDMYTTRNIYWLSAGGSNGQRMNLLDGTPSGIAPVPAHFPVKHHAEKDSFYWQNIPNGAGQDHWFWGVRYTAPVSKSYNLSLSNVSTAATTATVRVRLKGYTDVGTNPDHHTRIYLNNNQIDDQLWDGQMIYDHQVNASHSLLVSGINSIQVEAVGDTGALVDQLVTNWIEIEYWNNYVAENDTLRFGSPLSGTFQFEVTDFSTNTVTLFDITDSTNVSFITNTTVVSDAGNYKLQFEDAAQPDSRYLALASAQYKTPVRVEIDHPSSWKYTANGADYVIITHPDFYTSTLPLANHRSATGLQVATVRVDDIYDEFNTGIFNPQAIRDFLAFAYTNWITTPTYVLLVGDANYDYKDNYSTGRINYIPAPIVETDDLGETPSDNWFVTISGADILPDMFIGRLSADNVEQVEDMVDKIILYEQNPPDASWNTRALLVADDEPAFESTSDQLTDLLPAVFSATKIYVDNYPPGDPTVDISAQINSGNLLVNYVGHGNSLRWGSWSGGRIYETDDILALNNSGKLPMIMVANCLNGFFNNPLETDALIPVAEAFLRLQNAGAVAVWAPTGLGYPSGHRALTTEFYMNVFQDEEYILGTATTAAKLAIAGQNPAWDELVETYVFFGDPAMRLGVPIGSPDEIIVYLPIISK